jgi:hypothetical protein
LEVLRRVGGFLFLAGAAAGAFIWGWDCFGERGDIVASGLLMSYALNGVKRELLLLDVNMKRRRHGMPGAECTANLNVPYVHAHTPVFGVNWRLAGFYAWVILWFYGGG